MNIGHPKSSPRPRLDELRDNVFMTGISLGTHHSGCFLCLVDSILCVVARGIGDATAGGLSYQIYMGIVKSRLFISLKIGGSAGLHQRLIWVTADTTYSLNRKSERIPRSLSELQGIFNNAVICYCDTVRDTTFWHIRGKYCD
jgi:hypothetical protein